MAYKAQTLIVSIHLPKLSKFLKIYWFAFLLRFCVSFEAIVIEFDTNHSYLNWNNVLEITQKYSQAVEWHFCKSLSISNCFNLYPNSLIVLDLSEDLDIQFKIAELCKEYKKIRLSFENKFSYIDEWTFYMTPSYLDQTEAFLQVLKYFDWDQGLVICDEEKNYLKNEFFKYSSKFNYLIIESGANTDDLVSRFIMSMGSTLYYLFMQTSESLELQSSLISKKLLTDGNGIILDQESGYNCTNDGSLIITAMGYEYVSSKEKYFQVSLEKTLDLLLNYTINDDENTPYIKTILKNNQKQNSFSLINIQNGERIILGSIIAKNVYLTGNLKFPGGVLAVPKSIKKILHLSIEAGTTNPNSSPLTVGYLGSLGTYAAKDMINEGITGILDNFQIQFFNFDCGVTIYNSTFANACYKKDIDKFGLAHIAAPGSGMAVGSMKSFKQLNLKFPLVGCANADASLNSTTNFPWFLRVQMSNSFAYSMIPLLIRAMGWRQVAVLYQNDTWGQSGYYYLLQSARNHDLNIINPENSRVMAPNLNRISVEKYKNVLQTIIDSQARFLIHIVQYPMCYYIMEQFYDLGLRKGDLILLTSVADILSFFDYDYLYRYKVFEIGIPMLSVYGQNWVGEIGQEAYFRVISTYKSTPSTFTCFYFDGAYLIGYTLDYMINRGLDITDPNKTMSVMRSQQFSGCTGKVSLEKGSNDRLLDTIQIPSNKLDNSGNITTYVVGQLKPYSTQIFIIQQPIIYADGSTIKPPDLRSTNYRCPFPDRQIKTFNKGRGLVFGICFAVALISVIITIYIWRRWWNISIEPLKEKQEISLQDFIVSATICIEFFQIASMGPDFSLISEVLADFSNSLSLSLDKIIKLENGLFWVVVDTVFGFIGLWLILCLVVLLRLDEKFPSVLIFRYLDILADYMMPVLGDLCFIPFVSMCLNIFVCDQSISDNFTDSFLAQDCYSFCWKDKHLVYAIISFLALLSYEPLAVFCRPLWQELQPLLHVKTTPLFLMTKTVVQVILIVMNKTIKRAESTAHAILFLIVLLGYITFIFKFRPYNYSRFSWWQGISLIGVVWLAFLSTISIFISGNSIIMFVVLCVGWAAIASFGIYVQAKKYPSLLYRKKGNDTANLLKFAFSFGKQSKIALAKIVPSASIKGSSHEL